VTSTSFPPRVGRRALLGMSAALSLGMAQASSRGAIARQANAEATLLTRGAIELPAETAIAWRVVREVAEPSPDAAFAPRATGFAVSLHPFYALLLTDEATGSAYRLGFGEGAFVRDGTAQRVVSLGESWVEYLRIKLAAEATPEEATGRDLVFAGPAFAMPARSFTLALQRAELAVGDAIGLPPGAGETLVVVVQGDVELEVGEAAPRDLLRAVIGSDSHYVARSVGPAAMIYGARESTRVLIATIY
jgi:hypothetical protein